MNDVQEFRVSELLGHKGSSTITYSRYGKESSLAAKRELIESLQFPMIRFDRFNQKG